MPRFVVHSATSAKLVTSAASALLCASICAPQAFAQRTPRPAPAARVTVPVRVAPPQTVAPPRLVSPPTIHAPVLRPPAILNAPPVILIHRARFNRAPFLGFRREFPIFLSPNCGPWGWAYGCVEWTVPSYATESSVTPLIYEPPPPVSYFYGYAQPALVNLYLKDGTPIAVTDYWFADDQVRFTLPEEDAKNTSGQAIPLDQLDVQKTISVNSRRGFRVVKRNEPLEQYLRDNPNPDPPLLQAPPKN